jgi:hypothetical protein
VQRPNSMGTLIQRTTTPSVCLLKLSGNETNVRQNIVFRIRPLSARLTPAVGLPEPTGAKPPRPLVDPHWPPL